MIITTYERVMRSRHKDTMTTYKDAKAYLTKAMQKTATPWEKAALLTYISRASNQEKYPSLCQQATKLKGDLYVTVYVIQD